MIFIYFQKLLVKIYKVIKITFSNYINMFYKSSRYNNFGQTIIKHNLKEYCEIGIQKELVDFKF